MEMTDQHSSGIEMNFRQFVQRILYRIQLRLAISQSYAITVSLSPTTRRVEARTSTRNEILVQLVGEERIRQRTEEVLHARGDSGEIVELVEILQVEILTSFETLSDQFRLAVSSRLAVDSFVVHACSLQLSVQYVKMERQSVPKASTASMHFVTTTGI